MGLDDLDGVNENTNARNRSGGRRKKKDEDIVEIGAEPNKKEFTKDKFEEVKEIIRDKTKYSVNQVLNNLSAADRYEVLHQAATWEEDDDIDSEYKSQKRCAICGTAGEGITVVIDGTRACVHHPIGKLAKHRGIDMPSPEDE